MMMGRACALCAKANRSQKTCASLWWWRANYLSKLTKLRGWVLRCISTVWKARAVDVASSGGSVRGEEKKGCWSRPLPTISNSSCPPHLWFTRQLFVEAAKTSPLWPTRPAHSIQGTEARRRAWVYSALLRRVWFFLRDFNNSFSRNIWRMCCGWTTWHALFAAMGYCHQAWACISEAGFRPCFDGRKVVELPVQFSNWASASICTRIPSPYWTRSTSCVHCALPWFKNLQQHYFAAVEPENMGSLIWFPDVGRLPGGTLSDRLLW